MFGEGTLWMLKVWVEWNSTKVNGQMNSSRMAKVVLSAASEHTHLSSSISVWVGRA